MKLHVIIEEVPETAGVYLGLALEKINAATNLKDAELLIKGMSSIGTYLGSNHLAIHRQNNGEIIAPRLAIVTKP